MPASKFDYVFFCFMAALLGNLMLLGLWAAKAANLSGQADGARPREGVQGWRTRLSQELQALPRLTRLGLMLLSALLLAWGAAVWWVTGHLWAGGVAIGIDAVIVALYFRLRRLNFRRFIAGFSPAARQAVAGAFGALFFAGVCLAPFSHYILRLFTLPGGLMDSAGHLNFIQPIEEKLKANDAPETRYLAAVANHLAGNVNRARELYQSLPGNPRAQKNLSALEKANLVPPEPLTAEDLFRGWAVWQWKRWLELAIQPGWVFSFGEHIDVPQWLASLSLLFVGTLLVDLALLVAFRRIPSANLGDLPPPRNSALRALAKGGLLLVPGAYDLRRGSPWRGWLTFSLFAFWVVIGVTQFAIRAIRAEPVPAPGILSSVASPNPFRAFPFPTPPGLPDLQAVERYYYWTIFWTYPYIKIFLAVVVIAAITSLALHFARLRRIWRLYA